MTVKTLTLDNEESVTVLEMVWDCIERGMFNSDDEYERIAEWITTVSNGYGELNSTFQFEIQIKASVKSK